VTTRSRSSAIFLASALCACSGAPSSVPPASGSADGIATSVARSAPSSHKDFGKSWYSPELGRAKNVLFVSDAGTADVYIYKLPNLKLMATITGFSQPQGECSDRKGDVWITDTAAHTIYELSHHGRLENEIKISGGNPVACAWDPTTGNLAVMNIFGADSTGGNVLVYPKGSGSPGSYQNPGQYFYNFGGYDDSGDLFFDGRDSTGKFVLSELPRGAKSANTIVLSGGTIYFPGMVQWVSAKKGLIVGDQSCGNLYASCLYAVAVIQQNGTIGTQTPLHDSTGSAVCDMVQGVEFNGTLAGSDYDFCRSTASATYLWSYPIGGNPFATDSSVDSTPIGAAISK
jgi:hypothetical protein